MTPICDATLEAIAGERSLTAIERRHAQSCERCRRTAEIPQRISAASRALSSIEPHIGFAVRAVSVARTRSRRRRVALVSGTVAAAAAAAVLVVVLWPPGTGDDVDVVAEQPQPPPAPVDQERLIQPAQDFEPKWLLDHDDVLSLTKQQREKLRDLVADARQRIVALEAKVEVEEIGLSRELRREKPSRKTISGHITRIARLEGQLRSARTMAWLDARAALSNDQRVLVSSLAGIEHPEDAQQPEETTSPEHDSSDRVAELERKLKLEREARKQLERKLEAKTSKRKLEIYESYDDSDAEKGRLMVNSKPYAIVYIDGRKVGLTPLILDVDPGRHRVVLTRPDLGAKKTYFLTIKPGATRKLATQLDTFE